MNKKLTSILAVLAIVVLSGCATGSKPLISPSVVQQGVTAGVKAGTLKWPTAIPYVEASVAVICSEAAGTNLSPAQVVADLEKSGAAAFKTVEGVLIVQGGLLLYTTIWNAFGADAVNNAPVFKGYLQAVCQGMHDGLPPSGDTAGARARRNAPDTSKAWPQLKFP